MGVFSNKIRLRLHFFDWLWREKFVLTPDKQVTLNSANCFVMLPFLPLLTPSGNFFEGGKAVFQHLLIVF